MAHNILSLVQRLVSVFCIAEGLCKHGDNVLISGRRAELLGEVQARLSKEYGVRVETLVLDVRSREDIETRFLQLSRALVASICSLIMQVLLGL